MANSEESGKKIDLNLQSNPSLAKKTSSDISLKQVFTDEWQILKQTILFTFILIILFSIGTALFRLIYMNADWYILSMNDDYLAILEKLKNPEYIPTGDEMFLRNSYQIYSLLTLIARWAIPFFTLFGITLLTTGKIYGLMTDEKGSPETWKESLKNPFRTRKKAFTSILFLFIFPIFVTFGLVLMVIPGILIFLNWMFSIHAIVVDDGSGRTVLKGGRFYARYHMKSLIILFFLGVFLPYLIGALISSNIVPLLGYTSDYYANLLNPTTRNPFLLFIYYVVIHLVENIWFIGFPSLIGVTFFQIRDIKLQLFKTNPKPNLQKNLPTKSVKPSSSIKIVSVDPSKDYYFCPECKNRLPLSSRKCTQCGTLIQLKPQRSP